MGHRPVLSGGDRLTVTALIIFTMLAGVGLMSLASAIFVGRDWIVRLAAIWKENHEHQEEI